MARIEDSLKKKHQHLRRDDTISQWLSGFLFCCQKKKEEKGGRYNEEDGDNEAVDALKDKMREQRRNRKKGKKGD